MIEKEQRPIVDWMFEKTMRPMVYKTLATFMMMEMQKLASAVAKAEYIPGWEKKSFFRDLTTKDAVKQKFIVGLENLKKSKHEIIEEIMKQNSLIKGNSDATDYYDKLDIVFEEEWALIYKIIGNCEYSRLMTEYYDIGN